MNEKITYEISDFSSFFESLVCCPTVALEFIEFVEFDDVAFVEEEFVSVF